MHFIMAQWKLLLDDVCFVICLSFDREPSTSQYKYLDVFMCSLLLALAKNACKLHLNFSLRTDHLSSPERRLLHDWKICRAVLHRKKDKFNTGVIIIIIIIVHFLYISIISFSVYLFVHRKQQTTRVSGSLLFVVMQFTSAWKSTTPFHRKTIITNRTRTVSRDYQMVRVFESTTMATSHG